MNSLVSTFSSFSPKGHKFEDEDAAAGSSPKGDSALDSSVSAVSAAPSVDLLGGLSEPVASEGPRAPGGIDDLLGGLDIGGGGSSAADASQAQLPVLLSDPVKGVVVQVGGTTAYM